MTSNAMIDNAIKKLIFAKELQAGGALHHRVTSLLRLAISDISKAEQTALKEAIQKAGI